MRSVLEYACPVWHCGLTVKEFSDLEGVQKRVMRIIWPDLRYSEALDRAGLERLDIRRENCVRQTVEAMSDPCHILHDLLPRKIADRITRNTYPYVLPKIRTLRYLKSFIPHCVRNSY